MTDEQFTGELVSVGMVDFVKIGSDGTYVNPVHVAAVSNRQQLPGSIVTIVGGVQVTSDMTAEQVVEALTATHG